MRPKRTKRKAPPTCFFPDGSAIAALADGTLKLWPAKSFPAENATAPQHTWLCQNCLENLRRGLTVLTPEGPVPPLPKPVVTSRIVP